jgi:hypothetical protein
VDGVVVSAVYVEDGSPAEVGFPTVDGLFDVLEEAVRRDAHRVDVTWDPETGVPVDLYVDYDENVADEETGYRVTEIPTPLDPV